MSKIRKIEPRKSKYKAKKRVAAYTRVSKDSERLMHSLSAQVSHYSALIQSNPEWEYAGVYSDEGITGTIAKKRTAFQELLEDCDAGKIDLILVKSISRFARNTVDLLKTVRHLKDIGVEVYFEKERIRTFSGEGELMLSLLASIAQEESRSMSENIKWAFRKRYEAGRPHFRFRILGYEWQDDCLVINDVEAGIVRRIYREYLNGTKLEDISEGLYADGMLSINGKKILPPQVYKILTNITYTGNLLCQKTFIKDPISKESKRNEGELPQYYIENFHEPIIDMETFEAVKTEMVRRHMFFGEWRNNSNYGHYGLSGKIKCSLCGRSFNRKIRSENMSGGRTVYWICRSVLQGCRCANSRALPDKVLKKECCELLDLFEYDDQTVVDRLEKIEVPEYGRLEFYLKDGRRVEKNWVSNARCESWDEERRKRQAQKMREYHRKNTLFGNMIICGQCGQPVGKYVQMYQGIATNYWKCMNKESGCRQRGVREEVLKDAIAGALGQNEFVLETVKAEVESMRLLDHRTLKVETKDGRTIKIRMGGRKNGYSYEDTSKGGQPESEKGRDS